MAEPLERAAAGAIPQPFPVLLADCGGTNVRFALLAGPNAAIAMLARAETGAYPTFEAAAVLALAGVRTLPRSAVLCGAGPVVAGRIALTNAAWVLDPDAIAKALGLTTVRIVNDFEALAHSMASLGADDIMAIGTANCVVAGGTRLVLGPGTGFGAAALIADGDAAIAMPTECGQIDLGPVGVEEQALWPWLERPYGLISIESLLSGRGLGRLDLAIRHRDGMETATDRSAARIVELALTRGDASANAAVAMFLRLLARVTGDLALAYRAIGGVYLCGGVVRRLAPLIEPSAFRAIFEAKAPLSCLLQATPMHLITRDDPALLGLAAIAGGGGA